MFNILWENKMTKDDFSLLKSQFLLKFNLFEPLGWSYIHCSLDQIQKHECNYHMIEYKFKNKSYLCCTIILRIHILKNFKWRHKAMCVSSFNTNNFDQFLKLYKGMNMIMFMKKWHPKCGLINGMIGIVHQIVIDNYVKKSTFINPPLYVVVHFNTSITNHFD